MDGEEPLLDDQEVAAISDEVTTNYVVFKRRWIVLILYSSYCAVSALQWIQYSIIEDVIVKFYGVSSNWVNWTSVSFMVAFVFTIIPATWFFNKFGLRLSLLLATGGTCLGAWIKVFSIAPDRFWVTFLGQSIVALSQTYVLSISAPLAAIWFGPSQVSTATSIGVSGAQIGVAIGLVLPTYVVPNGTTKEIERGLTIMFYSVAAVCTLIFILQLLFLKSSPSSPPSAAQAQKLQNPENETVLEYLVSLVKSLGNINFTLNLIGYCIIIAVSSAVMTFLNQIILVHYPVDKYASYVGLIIFGSGLFGTLVVGCILDATKQYKAAVVILMVLSALSMIAFSFVLEISLTWLFVTSAVLGFVTNAYIPASFEFAAELTYPAPEATVTGVMAIGCQILSSLYTLAYGWLFNQYGDKISNLVMGGSLVLAGLITMFIKSDLRRQRAEINQNTTIQ